MKVLGLLVFVTVFLLSSAYADRRNGGRHSSLLAPEDRPHEGALQRRKPPAKPPGPALMANDQYQESKLRELLEDEQSRNVYLADKSKKHSYLESNDKKHKHVVNGDYNVANGEESQQERSRSLMPE